jgi:hypothetical protein
MFNMEGRRRARLIALLLCRRLEEVASVEKTTDGSKRDDKILRRPFAMMQVVNGTSTTMEAGEARVSIATKSTADLIGRENGSRQRRSVETLDEGVTGGIRGPTARGR